MEILEKNLEVIKTKIPKLYENIQECEKPKWFELIYSKNKMANFLIKNGGNVIPAYDIKNPLKVIKVKKDGLTKSNLTVVVGIGLGYHLSELVKKKDPGHNILIIEPNTYLVKKALELHNFSKYLENDTVTIIDTDDERIIAGMFSLYDQTQVVQRWFLSSEYYTIFRTDDYGEINLYVMRLINQMQCNIGTMEGAGYKIALNDIANLPYIIRHKGVNELEGIYRDKPCVIVSTGPSLQKNIHLLKEHRGNIVIIAVAQALRVLQAYDIEPDFIGTVDFGVVNEEHFRGLWDSDVTLVALNRSYDGILKRWQGNKIVSISKANVPESTSVGFLQKKGSLEQGGSVSHFCYGLALKMECDPIMFIGQDLAYEGDKSHIPLVDAGGDIKIDENGGLTWKIKDPRSTLKKDKKSKGSYSMGGAVPVDGYYGEPVLTNVGLASFITSYEGLFSVYNDKTYVNCTEGGAKLKGTIQMPLENALKKYCKKKINKSIIERYLGLEQGWKKNIKTIIPILEEEIEGLKKIKKFSKKALETCDKIQELNQKKRRPLTELKELLDKNEEFSNIAHTEAINSPLIGLYIYKYSRKLYAEEYNVKSSEGDALVKKRIDLKKRIKRNSMILKGAVEGAEELSKIYKESLGILKEYMKTNDDSLLIDRSPIKANLKDVEKYFKAGNWGHPYVDAKRVLANLPDYTDGEIKLAKDIYMRSTQLRQESIEKANNREDKTDLIKFNDYMEAAKKLGKPKKDKIDKRNFTGALEQLEKAHKLFPDNEQALWGLATTYHHVGKISKSVKYYKKLIDTCPGNQRYKFEYGLALLLQDTYAGMEQLKEVMAETDQFDSFLLNMAKMYFSKELYRECLIALKEYLKKFPVSIDGLLLLEDCFAQMDMGNDAEMTRQKRVKLQGNV
jgi:hypothetical protein